MKWPFALIKWPSALIKRPLAGWLGPAADEFFIRGHMNLATRSPNQEIWPLGCHSAKILDNIKGPCDKSVPAVFLAKLFLIRRAPTVASAPSSNQLLALESLQPWPQLGPNARSKSLQPLAARRPFQPDTFTHNNRLRNPSARDRPGLAR